MLQDLVNEFGRRLDFEAENGLYRGRRNAIGNDGIWRAKGEPDLIIEVKTTEIQTKIPLEPYRFEFRKDAKSGFSPPRCHSNKGCTSTTPF